MGLAQCTHPLTQTVALRRSRASGVSLCWEAPVVILALVPHISNPFHTQVVACYLRQTSRQSPEQDLDLSLLSP